VATDVIADELFIAKSSLMVAYILNMIC